LFAARALLPGPGDWIEDGGMLVAGGRIARVLRSRAAVRRAASGAAIFDLGDCLLAPGLVNAHAHLELSLLQGALPRGDFIAWIRALIASRERLSSADLERAVSLGAARLVQTGTTSVGDIDSTGACARLAAKLPLRTRVFREVLDGGDPARTAAALARVARALPRRRRVAEGISPHAPHTVSEELLRRVHELARARSLQIAVHWSETMEEREWLERGRGPFADLLVPRGSARSGLDLLDAASLLSRRTALIHGNHPRRGELERLARAGAVVVHCPGTHAFFDRESFPWRSYRKAGVRVALGTDSLASNTDLDLRAEMRLAREAASWLDPSEVFAMATTEGARALGLGGDVGELSGGACADFVAHASVPRTAREALESLTYGATSVVGAWVGGVRVHSGSGAGMTGMEPARAMVYCAVAPRPRGRRMGRSRHSSC
jgi:cytosine/adenosine deaminase-related metal-dependent hydrolase